MYCEQCGNEIPDGHLFCIICGKKIQELGDSDAGSIAREKARVGGPEEVFPKEPSIQETVEPRPIEDQVPTRIPWSDRIDFQTLGIIIVIALIFILIGIGLYISGSNQVDQAEENLDQLHDDWDYSTRMDDEEKEIEYGKRDICWGVVFIILGIIGCFFIIRSLYLSRGVR